MCGISGIINPDGKELSGLKPMTDIIRHRGPDGEGFVFFKNEGSPVVGGGSDTQAEVWKYESPSRPTERIENLSGKYQVGFGHRRLAILDLSPAGHQPLTDKDGRYWIAYNGEIYNYRELRNELKSSGYLFQTETDTEVILFAWQHWGIECQQKFNGMWAFAIYDTQDKTIFISRDRFGIKPLYYWFSPDGSFCFASEIKQFTILPGWIAQVNSQRAADFLVYSYTDHTEETLFSGVYQLPGGHYYQGSIKAIRPDLKGKIWPVRWYQIKQEQFTGTFQQAAEKFEILFKNAVKLSMHADVPIGTALSGGLDSSAIVCEISNILKNQGMNQLQMTFSSCSSDERFDEKKWMDIVIKDSDINPFFVYPTLQDVFKYTPDLIFYHDEPYQSQSAFLGYRVFELSKLNKVKVLLNGQGADEYLGGYGQFTTPRLAKKFKNLQWIEIAGEILGKENFDKYSFQYLAKTFISSLIPKWLKGYLANHNNQLRRNKNNIDFSLLGALDMDPNDSIPQEFMSVKGISKHCTFYSTLPKYLKWEDRNSMANSVEARVPFLDYRLVEFAYNLPVDYLDFKGETKRILREGLRNILPKAIKNRKDKNGFLTPEKKWVKEDNPELFRNKIAEAIEVTKGIIKPEALTYFDNMVKGEIEFDYTYWRLILFAEWVKCFNVKLN